MRLSIIVPIYNIEDYLERCINSILNQTYRDFELILVDDGSTDKSGQIVDEFATRDSRIVAIHKPNGGSSSARNQAIKLAQGDYLSFIDSDDYIEPFMMEQLMAPVLKAEAEGKPVPKIVQIGRDEVDEEGNKLPDICTPPEEAEFVSSKDFFRSLIMHVGDCSFCTKITARDLFAGREFPCGKLNEDFHLLVDMLTYVDGVMNLPGYAYHVFYRIGSNTRKKNKDDFSRVFQDCIDNANEVTELVNRSFPDLKEEALRFNIFQRLEYMLHIPISKMVKTYAGYPECLAYLRRHWAIGMRNIYLTRKNKIYMTLFAVAPMFVRRVHAKIKGFD